MNELQDPIRRLMSTARNARITYHVLRSNSAGVTVYMQAQMEENCSDTWPYRQPYVIAYEAETEGGRQQRQVIAETDSAEGLQAVLTLIESHVRRIKRQLLPRLLENRRVEPRQIAICSGFRTDAMRFEVLASLATLCKGPLKSQAYTGFTNSVYSSIDDWLSELPVSNAEKLEEDVYIACDWVQGLAMPAAQYGV